ncbi:hypothetical protein ACHAWO_001204 [Cyclotella atomus]|uniref:Endonuclease/exonuclease/phosphatase domain-containing protein n=1 Tax=Cyclotella atomus TaxID=382360 RepID=A0ABD3PA93_9STRA
MSRGLEIATDIDVTDELGIDIMGLQETKKPWNAANIRLYNQQTQLKWPQGARNIFSSAPWKYDEKDYMAGGTLLSINGRTKGRIVETGSDKWGRFCFTTLRGARDEGVVVINGYRTCHTKTDNPGSLTQYHAEYVGLRETGIKNPEPRFQFFKDLTTLIDEKRQQGFRPIVMMDANEDWVAESHKKQGNKLQKFMQQTQLVDPYYMKFNKAPRTYIRGTSRLDYILVDPALVPAIKRIGYMGSTEGNRSDHTMAFVDFDEKILFKGLINRPTEIHSREFMICQDDKKLKFTTLSRTQFIIHKIAERVMALAADFVEAGATDNNIIRYAKLDTEIVELIKCAAKKAGRKKFGYMRSPDLVHAGQLLMLYKSLLSCKLRRQSLPASCIKSAERLKVDVSLFDSHTTKYYQQQVRKRRQELWEVQKDCENRRIFWLQQLAEDRTRAAGEQDWEKKMKNMKKTVEESQINRKLSAITKGTHSQLDRIQVPTGEWYYSEKESELYHYDHGVWEAYPRKEPNPNTYWTHHTLKVVPDDAVPVLVEKSTTQIEITDFPEVVEPMWRDVTDTEEIKHLLLARNKRHLQQADIEGGTSSTPLMKLVRSEHGLSKFNDSILNGTYTTTLETTPELIDWFEAIRKPAIPIVDTVVGIIPKNEYQEMFKNATEKTSSGGEIHYTLWKALAEQDDFAEFLKQAFKRSTYYASGHRVPPPDQPNKGLGYYLCPDGMDYIDNGWIIDLRKRLNDIGGQLWVEDAWQPKPQREGDYSLMERFLSVKTTKTQRKQLRMVLHWLRVITIADLADPTGQYIPGEKLTGDWQAESPFEWPQQPKPSKRAFALFRKFLRNTICLNESSWQPPNSDLSITTPLGQWLTGIQRNVIPSCCRTQDAIYHRDDETGTISHFTIKGNCGFFKYVGEVLDFPTKAHPIDCRFVDGDKIWTSRRYRPHVPIIQEAKAPGHILHDSLDRSNTFLKGASDGSLFRDKEVMTAGWILANDTEHMTATRRFSELESATISCFLDS